MSLKFIHLTDTHMIGGTDLLYGSNPRERLERAVESINSEHGDASFVVLTGDLTHWGEEDAYAAFSTRIGRLEIPYVLMLGNHDKGSAFSDAFPDAPLDENGFVQCAKQTEEGRMLFLDTSEPGTHAGIYCEKRRAWLSQRLEESEGPVTLFMHHPPFAVGLQGMDAICLQQADEFWQVLKPHHARIQHIFFGHLHRTLYGNWHGISFSCMPGLNHQVALDLRTGPDTVYGSLEPPAYGVVFLSEDMLLVHQHNFLDTSPRFSLGPPDGKEPRSYALSFKKA